MTVKSEAAHLERLQRLLNEGRLTQEEFDEFARSVTVLGQIMVSVVTSLLVMKTTCVIAGKRDIRWIDGLATVMLTRIPYLFLVSILCAASLLTDDGLKTLLVGDGQKLTAFLIVAVMTCLVWMLVMVFQGLRAVSGLRGRRLWWVYLITVFACEAIALNLIRNSWFPLI